MLHEFLSENRLDLIARCRAKVAQRPSSDANSVELEHGVTPFLDQLIKTLQVEQTAEPLCSREVSGPPGGENPVLSEIGQTAALHGQELLQHGFTVEQVVRDYGDLCQAVTDLAFEQEMPIETDEFRTLNRCLDNGIAEAVTAFSSRHDVLMSDDQAHLFNQQLGSFTHELRNLLTTATLALHAIKAGNVGLTGATGAVLDRSMVRLHNLVDRSLTEVRMAAKIPMRHQLFLLANFIAEVKVSAALEAQVRGCTLSVYPIDPQLFVNADRDLLFSAVGNLLQNAFKFTRPNTTVTLSAYSSVDRILIDVADHCGGLPAGFEEKIFLPFVQGSADKSGLGLGLSLARLSIEANQGILSVRNKPGSGCVFTIDLPRHVPPKAATSDAPIS